jgi:DNA-binding NtrC family response regulator
VLLEFADTGAGMDAKTLRHVSHFVPEDCLDGAFTQESVVASHPARGGHETILLVEDEPAILKLATSILELNGYTVATASTPEAALAWVSANETPLHLVVSDVMMPRINGGALRERMLALRPGLKFLFISGYSGDALGGIDLGGPGIGFLHKPFSADALARKVRNLLDALQPSG